MAAITELAVTSMAVAPGEKFQRFGKTAAPAYLWFKKDKGPALTSVKIVHGDVSPGPLYQKLESEVAANYGSTIWYSTTVEASPILDLKIFTTDEVGAGPEFLRENTVLNPKAQPNQPQEYLYIKTKASQAKVDNQDYQKGDLVDVLDTAQEWLVGRVVEYDDAKGEFFIHYEGWADKWNEYVPRKSNRIAPHRSRTRGKQTGFAGDRQAFNLCEDVANFERYEQFVANAAKKIMVCTQLCMHVSTHACTYVCM